MLTHSVMWRVVLILLVSLWIPVAIMLVSMLARVPIYVAILAASFYLQVFVNHVGPQAIFAGLYDGIVKPSLLAVPFFILAGNLVDHSSMGERLVQMVMKLTGRVRGGAAVSCVVANGIFGAISGSAPAATATIGKITFDSIEKIDGEKLALGCVASSGALASIIPPSISMIIYGIAAEVSIGKLYAAGFVPGIITVLVLSTYLIVRGKPHKHQGNDHQFSAGLRQSVPVLLFPVVVLGGIYLGIFTPTEAGAVAAAYAFFIPLIIYKDFTIEKLKRCILEATRTTAQLFIIIASSITLAQALTMAQVPEMLIEALAHLSPTAFLLLTAGVLFLAGMFFEPGSAILILAPIMAPIAAKLGIDPIHFSMVVVFNISIGMFTPPFGLNLFVTQAVLRRPLERIASSVGPFILLYLAVLLLLIFIPPLSTWLPTLIYGG